MSERLCIHCIHCEDPHTQASKCAHPSNLSLVDGKPNHYCSVMRLKHQRCGVEARLFEPRGAQVIDVQTRPASVLRRLKGHR